jgi:hypothetical protein
VARQPLIRHEEHTVNDPYRITEGPQTPHRAAAGGGLARPLLWLLLVISAAGNMVTSTTGVNVFVSAAFGVVTLACATALIVQHYRQRRAR